MSLTQQIQKQKTFEDICPKWSRMFKMMDEGTFVTYHDPFKESTERKYGLSIIQSHFCVVGEAHGFSDKYVQFGSDNCEKCRSFSHGNILTAYHTKSEKQRHYIINSFVEHWNDCHV